MVCKMKKPFEQTWTLTNHAFVTWRKSSQLKMCFLIKSIWRDFFYWFWSGNSYPLIFRCLPCLHWWISGCCWSSSTWMLCQEVPCKMEFHKWSLWTPGSYFDFPCTCGSISTSLYQYNFWKNHFHHLLYNHFENFSQQLGYDQNWKMWPKPWHDEIFPKFSKLI